MRNSNGQTPLQATVTAWLPDALNDPDSPLFWRARLILGASLLLSILILLSAVLQSLSGIMSVALVAFASLMLMPVIPILLRYTGSVAIAGNFLTGSYFASVTAFSLASHGTATGAVLSLILVAPLGFLAPGVVWPSLWATLVCIQISLTPMMSQLPFEQLITTDPETARLALYQLPVLITIFTLAGGLLTNTILRHGDRRKQQAQRYMVELNVEKERLEEAMLERQKNLASVGTLAASVAHQINNPVGSILAAAQFALITKGDADYDEVASDAFVTIAAEAKRCGQIVHSLLRLSVGEHGEVWEEDIHGVVESAYNATRPYAQELGAELDLKLTETSSRLLISPIELEQAIVNLIRNGLEARTTGARVVVRTVSDTVSVRIQVVDNGTGLADPENAFDAFYTTRAAAGGTGLGLTVVRGIVEEHGGSVRAFPLADGPGTIFEIELPRHRVTDDCGSS